ncbi:MAG: hypothetical protein ACLQPD_25140 [Desulfomonilaceae bacterium]
MSEGKLGKKKKSKGAKSMEAKNLEEKESKNLSPEQAMLESVYEYPLKQLGEEEKSSLLKYASDILGKDGQIEVKRLILERRLPIIVGNDGNWYTDWFPEEFVAPVVQLLSTARYVYSDLHESTSPEYDLRDRLKSAVLGMRNQLYRLAMQLANEGEHSSVLERQIDCLENLNMRLPFSPEELSEILN